MNVLFIIFNRPQETERVFEAIRLARPSQLFIAADGPRADVPSEKELCSETRKIISRIDWPCQVKTRLQESNQGCRNHVSSAISWFFDHVEEGIILEDDCLPDQSFFSFSQAILEKYKSNQKIMHVSGVNFQQGHARGKGTPAPSYYFSRSPHIWGWATWRRAWQTYDVDMKDLDAYVDSKIIYSLFKSRKVADFWISLFKHIKIKDVDTWDAQWAYAIMKSEGLAITPNVNLIENIGFGGSSTHTSTRSASQTKTACMMIPIIHPEITEADQEADDFLTKTVYIEPFWKKLFRSLKIR